MEKLEILDRLLWQEEEKHKATGEERILREMLACNVECAGHFKPGYKVECTEEQAIRWLYDNLPGASYIVRKFINLIFSNGLTTGDEEQDIKLKDFLYDTNIHGVTNYSVLQEGIKDAVIYGRTGLRWLNRENGLVNVKSEYYGLIKEKNKEFGGFYETKAYVVSNSKQKMRDIKIDDTFEFDQNAFYETGRLISEDENLILLFADEFLNLRNDTSKDKGDTPFAHDRQRIKLLTTIYERLNYDLEYDGPGRIIISLKDGSLADDNVDSEVSTGMALNKSVMAMDSREDKVKKELAHVANQLKNSRSDQVIGLGSIFDRNITHLPRTTKATEFFGYIQNTRDVEITAQIFGLSPVLAEVGSVSGNISQESKIDNAILNDIVPFRELFALQISTFLSEKIGVDKIYFDKYELKQSVNENEQVLVRIEAIKEAYQAEQDDLVDVLVEELINDLIPLDGIRTLSVKGLTTKIKRTRERRRILKDVKH